MNHKNKVLLSVSCAILAALFFAIMSALNKVARTEISTEMTLFFRFSIGLLISLPFFMGFKSFTFKTHIYWLHLARAFTAFFGIFCLVYPIKYIPIVNVVLLGITYPLFIPLLVYFFYRKRLSLKMVLAIVIGFIGVIFVIQPDPTHLIDSYSLIALLGGLLIGFSMLAVRASHKKATSEQISFYYLLHATVIGLMMAAFDWQWPSAKMWPVVIAIGVTGTIYQQMLVYALRFAHASLVSPIMYSSILFSTLIEWLFWAKVPNASVWFGFALVFIGACTTVWIQRQADHLTRR